MGNSVEITPVATPRESPLTLGLPRLQGLTLLALIVWLYYSILYRLGAQWIIDPNFSHGFFVPAFALFVLWQDRKRLETVESKPSWFGIPVIVIALLMLVLGQLGSELFSSRVSFLILLAGLIFLFRGWAFFRAVLFPWAFLFLMIPLPNLILQSFTFPLQIFASKVSTSLLHLVGIPVLREGNIIQLASMSLEVAEACSGLRSLLSLLTLAIIYGYLMENRNWVRVVLACAAVPIAVVANVFRIFGTGLVGQFWDPDKAQGFFHEFQGWLVFVVSLTLLFTVHRLINLIWGSGRGAQGQEPLSPRPNSWGRARPATPSGALRFGIAAVLLLATASGLQAHSQNEVFPSREPLSSLPMQVDGWTGADETIDQASLDVLGPGEFFLRNYEAPGQPEINVYVAYFPTQRMGDTIHSPNHCLPGGGWVPVLRQRVPLKGSDGTSFPVNRYVVTKRGERQLVLYWFQAHGREVASEYAAKYYLIADSIKMNRSDGAVVRLMSMMNPGETPEAAQQRVMRLGDHLLPLLDQYIPK